VRIKITFPDGSKYVFDYEISGYESIDDIVEAIANEIARRYVESRGITSKKTYLKVKAGAMPWIRSHLIGAILEEIERRKRK